MAPKCLFIMNIGATKKKAYTLTSFPVSIYSSSPNKLDSGTGWPGFAQPPHTQEYRLTSRQQSLYERVEVRSKNADLYLNHVFDSSPLPTERRFCINSAVLRFIPREDLGKEGCGEIPSLFEKQAFPYSPLSEFSKNR